MRYTVEDICRMSEGQTFDCKSIKIDPKALATTIVAMANADGGLIAVGVTDKTRRIEGVDQEQDHLNEILRTPFDFCVPTVSVSTEFLPCKDSEGHDNHILLFHVPASPRLHPSFRQTSSRFLSCARVRFIRYYGTEEKVGREMNVIKDVTFEGRILDQIQKTIDYLETQVKEHSYMGEDGLFKTDREYPKFVIQEMTVNSVCHRDYSIKGTEIQIKMFDDRLVFETPGKLPGIVRTDNIRHTHFSRNPKIAEYLKAYDYVKEFGEGVDRMCRELSAVGTKDPEYHLVSFLMKATVWANVLEDGLITNFVGANGGIMDQKRPEGDQKSDQMHQIIDLIKRNPKISRAELSEKTGLHDSSVKRRLKILVDEGFIKRIGPDKGGYWQLLK